LLIKGDQHSHFHEKLIAQMKVRLSQANADWKRLIGIKPVFLHPISGCRIASLVYDMVAGRRHSRSEWSKSAKESKESQMHLDCTESIRHLQKLVIKQRGGQVA